ncbi:hypothetical protein PFISCL1PPCAC_14394, partial [Pristionchus fissidentatus]
FLWLLDVTGAVKSTALRRTVVMSTSVVALISPLITLYYLPAYNRTPKSLSAYSVILLATAIVDLVVASCSWMTTVRLAFEDGVIVLDYIGPCTLISVSTCHALFSLHAGAACQSIVMLLISFAYRLWSVRHSSSIIIKGKSTKLILVAICVL